MSAGPIPLRYVEETGDRRDSDRRAADRRAPRRWLDPLFAATLVNQIAPAETRYAHGYATAKRGPRPGIVVNVRT
jgi:hypothetical protein